MKIIDKYISRGFIWPFLYCLFMFLFLYLVIDLFAHLDALIKQAVPFSAIKTYYFSSMPFIFVQTAPFAVLLATVFLLGNLNRHNEIVALRASGINHLRIISPILLLATLISFSVYLVNDRLVPEMSVTANTVKELWFEKNTKEGNNRLDNITVFGKNGRLFYARSYDTQDKTLYDIVMLEHDNDQVLKRKVTAEKMQWFENKWRFFNCDVFRFDKNGAVIGKPAIFRTPKILQFAETPESLLKSQTQPELMNYSQLRDYIHLLSLENKSTAKKLLVDLNSKLSLPFTSIIITLIGAPFALKRSRAGALTSMGLSLAIAIIYYGANAIFLALGKGGFFPPLVSAWAANVLFAALGVYLIRKLEI
ncbi:MAG: LptF/LptG family permease [Candidatus Omnitrophota bacterium]